MLIDTYDPDFLIDTYEYGYGSGLDEVAASIIASYLGGFIVAMIALWVFSVLIRWKMFEKAGVAGWKSIIPIYGDYVEYTIVWEGKWFWFTLIAAVAASVLFMIPLIGPIIAVAAIVFLEIISVIFCMQEAKAFGQDTGFAIGLMFLPFVFKFFLGFDQAITYRGPQPSPQYFKTIQQQLPGASYAPQAQPGSYQQAYGQPQYYAPQPAPVAQPAPEVAPVVEDAPSTLPTPKFDPETGLPLE